MVDLDFAAILVANSGLTDSDCGVLFAVIREARMSRPCIEQARILRIYSLGSDASTENMILRFDQALKNLDKALAGHVLDNLNPLHNLSK